MAGAFVTAFLGGAPAAAGFLARDFRDGTARIEKVREASARPVSAEVLALLAAQNAALAPSPARRGNLDALAASGTALVVTGQQVGLFLGPLYAFYKAATAVALARHLEDESGVRCVPLYWLQTEDHDFAEIDHCDVLGRDGAPRRIALADTLAGAGARVSVKHRVLGASVIDAIEALVDALPPGAAADGVGGLLREHYGPGQAMGDAFAGLLGALFADEGLLVLDPREPTIARLAAPFYRRALLEHEAASRVLVDRGRALAAAGFDTQVRLRPESPLVFFHPDGVDGPRFRLQPGGQGAWTAGLSTAGSGRDVTTEDLLAAIEREPMRFSSSTLLRPLIQDALLPCAAYVGGPAEVSYFAQCGPLYDLFGVPQPLVVPRARFVCVDARTRARLAALGMSASEIGGEDGGAAESVARSLESGAARTAESSPVRDVPAVYAEAVLAAVDRLASAVRAADPSLVRPAERTRATVARAIDRLLGKHSRAMLARDQTGQRRLAAVRAALCPGGVAQECAYGWPSLAGRVGVAPFKQRIFEALGSPLDTRIREVDLP